MRLPGSYRRIAWSFFILCLCIGCSDVNTARQSGEYKLDGAATSKNSPGSGQFFKGVVLTLNSDGSFSLKGKFEGVSRTDRGTWKISGNQIILHFTSVGKQKKQFTRVAEIEDEKLILETQAGNREIKAVYQKRVSQGWMISIFSLVILIFTWVAYRHRDNPHISFYGGSPAHVTAFGTIICIAFFICGIVDSYKPEVGVWAAEISDLLSKIEYFGYLLFAAVVILVWAITERKAKNILWALLGLAVVGLLAWLRLRFGIEIEIGTGRP